MPRLLDPIEGWAANPEPDLDGYEVMWRESTDADWTHAIPVGNVTSASLPNFSRDNVFFGVRAIDPYGSLEPRNAGANGIRSADMDLATVSPTPSGPVHLGEPNRAASERHVTSMYAMYRNREASSRSPSGTSAARVEGILVRRTLWLAVLLGCFGSTAWADDRAHAEMTEALATQADLHPTPLTLPSTAAAPRHVAATSAVKQGTVPRAVTEAAGIAASRASQRAQAQAAPQALAHQTQAAASAVAEQAQSQAAKDRIAHPHSR